MKSKLILIFALALACLLPSLVWSQQLIGYSLTLKADPPGLVAGGSGNIVGNGGSVPLYYWLAARYPSGLALPAGPLRVVNTVGIANLSGSRYVSLSWRPASGATGYYVIRQDNPRFPQSGACTSCVVSANQAGTNFLDQGGGTTNWPPAGVSFASSSQISLAVNNRDDDTPFLQVSGGELHYDVTRSANAYAYLFKVTGNMTGGAAQKTYGISGLFTRPAGFAATGDSNDAIFRGTYSNYAANDANFIMRGVNTVVNNRSGGTLGILEGGLISASSKSGSTSPIVNGLTVNAENFGTNATQHSGIDVSLKNEAAKATLEFGVRVRNLNNSIGGTSGAAYLVTEPSLANTGWDYILDANGVKSPSGKFARLQSGVELISATGVPAGPLCTASNLGAIYLNHGGGGGTSLYVCEVIGAWAAK